MNLFSLSFMIFAKSESAGIIQILIAAIIIIGSVVTNVIAAKKKKQEQEQKRLRQKQTHRKPVPAPNRSQKYWGVKLDNIEEEVNEDDYDDEYIEYDEDDYDPLEPRYQPVQRNFAHKIKESPMLPEKHLGNLESKHLTSNIERGKFQSEIEMQQFVSDLDSLGELPDDANLISDDDYDNEDDDLNIQINVAKGSSEALVHAVVLGEIFGPPICMREPYAPKEDEDAFKNSTLL